MKILFVSRADPGNLNPMIGVAQWLLKAEHTVGWLGVPMPLRQAPTPGVEMLEMPGNPMTLPRKGGGDMATASDHSRLRAHIERRLKTETQAQVAPVREVIRAFHPDVIALDGFLESAVAAATLEKVPYMNVSPRLTILEEPDLDFPLLALLRSLMPVRREFFAQYDIDQKIINYDCISPWANSLFTTRELIGDDHPLPAHTFLVGPSIPPEDRGDGGELPERLATDLPIVYASFGSRVFRQPELFATIIAAATALPVQLVLSVGDLVDGDFIKGLPPNVLAVRYVAQLPLLSRTAAFITHGGANSTAEALFHGVPMVVVPIWLDQPLQAHLIQKSGIGFAMPPGSLTADSLRAALEALLDPVGPFTACAKRVQASYRTHDGAHTVADLLVRLGRDQAPLDTA